MDFYGTTSDIGTQHWFPTSPSQQYSKGEDESEVDSDEESENTLRIIMDETQIENAEMRKIRKMLEAEAGHPIHTLKFPENTLWVDDENDKSIEGNQTLWSEIEERKMLKNKNKTPKKAPVLLPKPKKVPSRVQKALLDIRNKISPNRKKYRLD